MTLLQLQSDYLAINKWLKFLKNLQLHNLIYQEWQETPQKIVASIKVKTILYALIIIIGTRFLLWNQHACSHKLHDCLNLHYYLQLYLPLN